MSTKFKEYNSPEYQIIKDVFESIPMMDVYIANIVEEYIYSTVIEYYPSNKSIKCKYLTKYGEKDGEYKEWHHNSNRISDLHIQTTYVNGKKHGEHKVWYRDSRLALNETEGRTDNSVEDRGQLRIQTMYVDDKIHGEYRYWDEDGELLIQTTCVNGKTHGEYKQFFTSGNLHIQTTYIDGKLHGEYKEWWERNSNEDQGHLYIQTNYIDDKIHGEYKEWLENGQLSQQTTYVDGVMI